MSRINFNLYDYQTVVYQPMITNHWFRTIVGNSVNSRKNNKKINIFKNENLKDDFRLKTSLNLSHKYEKSKGLNKKIRKFRRLSSVKGS